MTRLAIPALDDVPDASRDMLSAVRARLGMVPNLFRLLGSHPSVLAGFTALTEALGGALDVRTRERIAIAVAQADGCDYSLSAHRYLALNIARLCPDEIELNRRGASNDAKAAAAVRFAVAVAGTRGHVTDEALDAVRAAGFDDPSIVAIVALVSLNDLCHRLNAVARTELDFPVLRCADLE